MLNNGESMDIKVKEWKCDNCGCCCRTKKCTHYTKDGKCDIYETRPDECRTNVAHKKFRPDLTWEQFLELSKMYCVFINQIEKFNRRVK